MPTLAGLDGGSLLPDFMGSFNKGMEFRQGVDKNRLTPELIERARKGDQEAINQLIAINPEALKDSFELPSLGDISAAKSAAAKSQTMIAEATQERGRLIKLKNNIAASLKDGPDNLRTNVLKLASGKMDENDPDFNMQDVVDILKISATDPERAYKMLQEEAAGVEEGLSIVSQILGTGGEPFTLGVNDRRFDENNNLVATGQEKAASPTKIERLINARDKAIQSGDQSRVSLIDKAITKETSASKGINVNIGGEPAFKVPTGFMLKDASNPALGVTPIPGGPKDKEGGESAGKLQMLRTAETALQGASDLIFNEDGSPDWKNILAASANIPKTEGRELRNQMEFGIQAITRLETGAAMPESEVKNTRERFQPSVYDSPETIKLKMEMFKDFITGTIKLFDPSGRLDDERFMAELNKRKNQPDAMTSEVNIDDLVNKYAD